MTKHDKPTHIGLQHGHADSPSRALCGFVWYYQKHFQRQYLFDVLEYLDKKDEPWNWCKSCLQSPKLSLALLEVTEL